MFQLHPQLEADSVRIGLFRLSQVRLINDSNYPWALLVPERKGITEIHQLPPEDRAQLMEESAFLSEKLAVLFRADKMNIAAIGNMVPQLHIHHIVRYQTDPAWPAPVWGRFPMKPYPPEALQQTVAEIRTALAPQLQQPAASGA